MATQAESVADEIESLGSWNPGDPDDLHDTLRTLHRIQQATASAYKQIADTLDSTGVHSDYPEALQEHSSSLTSLADDLEDRIGGGVMKRGGG